MYSTNIKRTTTQEELLKAIYNCQCVGITAGDKYSKLIHITGNNFAIREINGVFTEGILLNKDQMLSHEAENTIFIPFGSITDIRTA